MPKSNFSEGEWTVLDGHPSRACLTIVTVAHDCALKDLFGYSEDIATVYMSCEGNGVATVEANARLFAESKRMYAVLNKIRDMVRGATAKEIDSIIKRVEDTDNKHFMKRQMSGPINREYENLGNEANA